MTNQIAPKPSLGQALYAKAVESMQPKAVSPPLESSSSVSEYNDSARSPSVGSPTAPSRSSAYYEGEDDDEIVANMNRVTLGRVPSYATSHNHVPGRLPRAELAGAAHGGRLQTVDELEQYDLGTTTHTTRHLPTHRHTTPLTLTPSTTSPDRLSTTARLPAPSMYPSSYTLPEDEPVEPAALYPSPFTQSTRLLNSQTGTGGRMEDGIRRNASVGGGGLGRAVSMNASIPATNGGAAAHTHSRMRDQTQPQAHIPISTSGPSYGYAQTNPRRHSTSTNTSTSTFTSLSPTSPSFPPSSTSSTPSSIGKQKTTVVHTLAALNPNPQPSKHPSVPPVQHIKMSAASAHVPRAINRVTQPQPQPQVVVDSQQQSFVGGQTVLLSQSSLPNQVQQVPLQQQQVVLQPQQQAILQPQQQTVPQQQQPVQYQLQYQRNPSQVQIPPPPPLPPAPVLAPAPNNNTSQNALLGAAGTMAGLLGAAAVNTLVNGDPTESVISLSDLGLGGDSQVDGSEYASVPTTYAVDPMAGQQQPLQQPQEHANVGAVVPTTTAADPNSAVQLQMLQMQQQQQIQQNYHEMQTQMQLAQMQMAIQQQQQAQQAQAPVTTQRPPVAGQTYAYAYAQPTQPQMQVQQQQVPLTQTHMNTSATTTYTQQQLQQQQMIAQQQQIIAQQQAQIQAQAQRQQQQQQQQQQQASTSAAGSSQSTTDTIINSLSSPVGQAALGVALKVGGTLLGQMLSSDDS